MKTTTLIAFCHSAYPQNIHVDESWDMARVFVRGNPKPDGSPGKDLMATFTKEEWDNFKWELCHEEG